MSNISTPQESDTSEYGSAYWRKAFTPRSYHQAVLQALDSGAISYQQAACRLNQALRLQTINQSHHARAMAV